MFASKRIEPDRSRFKKIVRGTVRSNIRKYISRGELIGRRGKEIVSIPLPQLEIPRFRFGKAKEGIGQGEGEVGEPVRFEPGKEGPAGSDPSEHILEVEISLEELARIMGEELALPDIEPKGRRNIAADKDRYVAISKSGPESLRHFKRTFRRALRRQIITGTYDPEDPRVWPVKEDKLYRSWKRTEEPDANAIIIYMMDVSGSMGDEQKERVRLISFWIDTWLMSQYRGVERRFIIHDAAARVVDRETFFHTRESGGTKISSAYKCCLELIRVHFPPDQYNIYAFHFSDGDNFPEDDGSAIELLKELLPNVNLFCYGQVPGIYGAGHFLELLEKYPAKDDGTLLTAQIPDRESIYDAIKRFLGTGR